MYIDIIFMEVEMTRDGDQKLLLVVHRAVKAIDEQIQKLQEVKAEILAALPDIPINGAESISSAGNRKSTEDSTSSAFSSDGYDDLVSMLRRKEGQTWKITVATLLKDNAKLRRKEIIQKLGISKHTLNALLSKNKGLFQHDDLGYWSLKTNEPMPELSQHSAPQNEL
jgi:hypothetical protein